MESNLLVETHLTRESKSQREKRSVTYQIIQRGSIVLIKIVLKSNTAV